MPQPSPQPPPGSAYHVTQWHLYERSDTRKTDYMSWYPKQTKLTGIGIGLTLRQAQGLKLLGLWNLIEILASLSAARDRGWLVRGGAALTADDMASLVPAVPAADFQEALDWFSQPRIQWLEQAPWPPLGKSPGTSPGVLPTAAHAAGKSPGTSLRTDRQTDSLQTDSLQIDRQPKREREREEEPDLIGQTSAAAVQASRTQAGALLSQITALERRKADLTPSERQILRKKKRALAALQARQADGDFAPVQTSK